MARSAWRQLVEIDPTKEGFEPWVNAGDGKKVLTNAREFIVNKIISKEEEDHLFGFYLLKNSPHKQEIIAHPKWINVSDYTEFAKIGLGYALNHELNAKNPVEPFNTTPIESPLHIIFSPEPSDNLSALHKKSLFPIESA